MFTASGPDGKFPDEKATALGAGGRGFSYGSKERESRMLRPKMATMVSSRGLQPERAVTARTASRTFFALYMGHLHSLS